MKATWRRIDALEREEDRLEDAWLQTLPDADLEAIVADRDTPRLLASFAEFKRKRRAAKP